MALLWEIPFWKCSNHGTSTPRCEFIFSVFWTSCMSLITIGCFSNWSFNCSWNYHRKPSHLSSCVYCLATYAPWSYLTKLCVIGVVASYQIVNLHIDQVTNQYQQEYLQQPMAKKEDNLSLTMFLRDYHINSSFFPKIICQEYIPIRSTL